MKEHLPIMLDHSGLQEDTAEKSNTINTQINEEDHEADQ
jgi:hypothetical protein